MTHKGEDEVGFNNRSFPHWNDLYANETSIGSLPWYNKDLDNDLKEHLRTMNMTKGSARLNGLFVGTSTGSGALLLSIFTCHWPSLNGPVVTGEPEPHH
jgi:hypothetical protein